MSSYTAVYDACVLYPAPLRDFLLRLAMTGLFRARWTDDIHEEWITALLRNRPDLARKQLERTRTLMDQHVLGCKVSGYQSLISSLHLPDPDDRHVLAAAIRTRAHVIVTFNTKDFPDEELSQYGIEAQTPDVFARHLIDLSRPIVSRAAHEQRLALKNPPMDADAFLDCLEATGLPMTIGELRRYSDLL
ncbi:PIN domain-containing protein [bacterium]|nr:MAG: PIN domain-containing protein [bacterium]